MSNEGDSELVTTAEALKIMGVGRTTLYRMIARRELTPAPGKPALQKQPLYFYRKDVERIAKEGRKPAKND